MSQKKIMREFWKTIGLLSTILMVGALIPLFMAVHEAEARPGRLTSAGTLTVQEVTVIETNSTYVTNNITNIIYDDPNDPNDTVIDPPGKGSAGKVKIKGQTAATIEIGIITPDANFTDDVEIADDLILYGTARWASDPNLGDVGATETLDFSANNNYVVLISEALTVSVTDPGAGISKGTVIFYQTGAGSFLVTWPANFEWPADTAPTLSTTSGVYDVMSWVYWDVEDSYAVTMSIGHAPE